MLSCSQQKALNKRRESVSIFAGLSRKNKEVSVNSIVCWVSRLSKCQLQKRNSAPPLLSYNTNVETATPFQTTVAEGHEAGISVVEPYSLLIYILSQSVSPTRLPPSLVHKVCIMPAVLCRSPDSDIVSSLFNSIKALGFEPIQTWNRILHIHRSYSNWISRPS